MLRTFLTSASAFVTLSLALAAPSLAETKSYPDPMYKGARLDFCRVWGSECGQPAADAFCKKKGFASAATFKQDEDPGAPTKVISSGQVCNDDTCSAFSTITCTDAKSVKIDDDGGASQPADDVAQQGSDGEPAQDNTPNPTVVPLGGQLQGELEVTGNFFPTGQSVAVFGRGMDNALWWQNGDGKGKWNGWSSIGGQMKYSPSCVMFDKAIHCFVVGLDGALWTTQQDKKGGWYPFKSLGGVVTGTPGAVVADDAKGSNAIYVVVRTTAGQLSVIARYRDPDTDLYNWSDYRGLGVKSQTAVTCYAMGGTHVDCYGRNAKNEVVEFANALTKPSVLNLGGQIEKRPSAIIGAGYKQVRVLVKGLDGNLWYNKWMAGGSFSGWKKTNVAVNSQPACAYNVNAEAYLCFDVGPDKQARAIKLPKDILK